MATSCRPNICRRDVGVNILLSILGFLGLMAAGSSSGTKESESNLPVPDTDPDPDTNPDTDPDPDTNPDPNPAPLDTVSVFLINTQTDEVIMQLTEGAKISGDLVGNPNLSVIYLPETGTEIGSVTFNFANGAVVRTESNEPYALFGDANGGDILASPEAMFDDAGNFSLSVEVFEGENGSGATLAAQDISFVVEEPTVVEEPEEPEQPEEPEEPEQPEEPEEPEQPEEPEEPEQPEEPEGPEQPGGGSDDDDSGDVVTADSFVEAMAGRVTTLAPDSDDVASVRIVNDVDHGNITVNPDNTMALVMTMSDFTGSTDFSYEVTHTDGSTTTYNVALDVTPGAQDQGWGTGESHYTLATDENDKVIIEHGENHHKVYVSGSDDALSVADIAAREGLNASQIDGSWLANSQYGQSEDLALDEDAGSMLWNEVTPRYSTTSNWLLLERGYEYGTIGEDQFNPGTQIFVPRGATGESELNPIYIGAWGEGDRPELTSDYSQLVNPVGNIVFQDIHFSGGAGVLWTENLMFDNIEVTGGGMAIEISEGVTIRNSEIYDNFLNDPLNGSSWELDRIQGLYVGGVDGLLLDGNFFDHNGWAPDYDGSADAGLPPNKFNHNMYLQDDLLDVTLRDTITMRASSFGAGLRSGGFIEDNAFIDNNAGLSFDGGDYNNSGAKGQYSLVNGNVITSAGHKDAEEIGALSWGLNDNGEMTTLVDNIIAHLADPNNASEQNEKWDSGDALQLRKDPYFNDTIVYNWQGSDGKPSQDENVDGLNTNVLDQTTIQQFTAALLGNNNATIGDLADYLRDNSDGEFEGIVDADLIIRFFQTGFGIAPDLRATETTLRFIPDDLGDGVRWDNRLNWDTEDLPGTQDGDSVDLGGNHVVFGSNATIDTLDLGDDGYLNVYGGRLTAEGGITGDDGGKINIEGAGQLWINGSDADDLSIDVNGGRFLNSGDVTEADLTVSGGQTILAKDGGTFGVSDSKTLAIFDAAAKVGFDDDDGDQAILALDDGATLAFKADNGDLGTIEEFRSGAFGDNPDVNSGIQLGDSTLSIDLAGLSASDGAAFTLMSADEIAGIFSEANIEGLGGRNANIVIDYEADTVTLELSSGNGAISIDTVGQEDDVSDGQEALWAALTSGQGVFAETNDVDEEDDLLDAAA